MTVLEGSSLSPADQVALLEADELYVDGALHLLDSDGVFVADITDDLISGSVTYAETATLRRTCSLVVARQLVWGSARVRPWVLLSSDGETWYRWPLGLFSLETPVRSVGTSPVTYDVAGFDACLLALDTPHGSSVSVEVGDSILTAVETLLTGSGEAYSLDQTAAAVTATTTMVYSIVDVPSPVDGEDGIRAGQWSTLEVVNELLAAIGYEPLWSDDGTLRSAPIRLPADRPVVWTLDAGSDTTIVGEQRSLTADYWRAANWVRGVNNSLEDSIPVEGAGIYTAQNLADGPTSQAQRGRTIRVMITGQFADQASLVAAVDERLAVEKRVTEVIDVSCSPVPAIGHRSVVSYVDPEIPANGRFVCQAWTMHLDPSPMTLSLRAV